LTELSDRRCLEIIRQGFSVQPCASIVPPHLNPKEANFGVALSHEAVEDIEETRSNRLHLFH
jgi:hypothetical protein